MEHRYTVAFSKVNHKEREREKIWREREKKKTNQLLTFHYLYIYICNISQKRSTRILSRRENMDPSNFSKKEEKIENDDDDGVEDVRIDALDHRCLYKSR